CDLGLKAKAVSLEFDRVEHLASKDLVTNLHVGEVQVGQHVAEKSQTDIRDVVPEVKDTMGTAMKPISKNNIGSSLEDRIEEIGIIARIVFKISILHQDDVAGCMFEAGAQGSAFSTVAVVQNDLNGCAMRLLHLALDLRQHLTRAIAREVVYNHQLLLN